MGDTDGVGKFVLGDTELLPPFLDGLARICRESDLPGDLLLQFTSHAEGVCFSVYNHNGSTYTAGEDTFLVSSAINWAPYFKYIIKQFVNGDAIATDWCGTIETNSVVLSGINLDIVAEGTKAKMEEAIAKFKAGTLHVFDTSTWTLNGEHLTEYLADLDGDFTGDTNVIHDGYFDESNAKDFRSAPYFDIIIDGVTNLNVNFG